VGDDDVHARGPRPRGETPEEEPGDERHGLALVAVAEVDEDEPADRGDERDDEREGDARTPGDSFRIANALLSARAGLGISWGAPCTASAYRVARLAEKPFTSLSMQRGILLGVIVIVLLEGAERRLGG
jgi:hypothetical protein